MKILLLMGLMFVWGSQPLMMISSMLLIVLFYSMVIYYVMGSYWFSYMFMLVMLSGVMVLFTYMASLVPNENFELMSLIYLVMFMLIFMMMVDFNIMFMMDESMMSFKMWESIMSIYVIYIVIFLFMIMLMSVWMSNLGDGALRNL